MTSHNIFKFVQLLKVQRWKENTLAAVLESLSTLTEHMGGGQGGCDGTTNGNGKQTLNLTLFTVEIYSFYVWLSTTDRLPLLLLSLFYFSILLALSSLYDFTTVLERTTSQLGERNQGREGERKSTEVCFTGLSWGWARAESGDWNSGKVKPTVGAVQEELPRESASRHWQRGITQTWLLIFRPASVFSASFRGYSVQLLLPRPGSSNIQWSK